MGPDDLSGDIAEGPGPVEQGSKSICTVAGSCHGFTCSVLASCVRETYLLLSLETEALSFPNADQRRRLMWLHFDSLRSLSQSLIAQVPVRTTAAWQEHAPGAHSCCCRELPDSASRFAGGRAARRPAIVFPNQVLREIARHLCLGMSTFKARKSQVISCSTPPALRMCSKRPLGGMLVQIRTWPVEDASGKRVGPR